MRRSFPRWSNEPPMCRYGHGPMVEKDSELPKFVAAIGRADNGRRAHRKIWVCKLEACPWVAVGECECLLSLAFRKKEMNIKYLMGA